MDFEHPRDNRIRRAQVEDAGGAGDKGSGSDGEGGRGWWDRYRYVYSTVYLLVSTLCIHPESYRGSPVVCNINSSGRYFKTNCRYVVCKVGYSSC